MTQGPNWQPGMVPYTVMGQQQKAAYDAQQAAAKRAGRSMAAIYNPPASINYNTTSFTNSVTYSSNYSGTISKPTTFMGRIRTLLLAVFFLFVWWLGFSDPWTYPYTHFLWSFDHPDTNPYGHLLWGHYYGSYIMWSSFSLGIIQFLRIFRSRYA